MRDPERIDKILNAVSELWHKYPDLRLTQLIANCFPSSANDNYYREDDVLLTKLKETYK